MIEILLVLAFISECPFLEIASRVRVSIGTIAKGHLSTHLNVHTGGMAPSIDADGTLDFKSNCEK